MEYLPQKEMLWRVNLTDDYSLAKDSVNEISSKDAGTSDFGAKQL